VAHLPGGASQRATEVAERYADGRASLRELDEAGEAADAEGGALSFDQLNPAVAVTGWAPDRVAVNASAYTAGWQVAPALALGQWDTTFAAVRAQHCDLLRDIAGNPFHPVIIPLSVLAWSGGTVVKLAQTIYEERLWEDLPILADALEDAGCTDADVLAHCRAGGQHARGCWLVDLLLGKS
jgi:hypothetical protein